MTYGTGLPFTVGRAQRRRRPAKSSVYSPERTISPPLLDKLPGLKFNKRLAMDGITLLKKIPVECVPVVFFDPQYRGILDKQSYGNEGKSRGQQRCSLSQMTEDLIQEFISEISRVLIPSGHLFLWMDKFHLCTGFGGWIEGTGLCTVDMITWNKKRIGMGYRTRRCSEHLVVLQKAPRRAKGVWKRHDIPDVWDERVDRSNGVHPKPIGLQARLIEAVSNPQDLVVDPAAGSFSVLEACRDTGRNFLGCDLNG